METNMIITGLEEQFELIEEIQKDLSKISYKIRKLSDAVCDARPKIEIKRASDKAEADPNSDIAF